MADVGQIPLLNFGLSQAQQAQAGASANLENVQAQGAQIQNQRAAMMLQMFKQGLGHLNDFSGQNGGQDRTLPDINPTSNNTGTGSPLAQQPGQNGQQPGQNGQQPGQQPGQQARTAYTDASPDASNAVAPEEDVGQSASDSGRIEAAIEQRYNVNPEGTPQEQQRVHQAFAQSQDPAIMAVPELKSWAEAQLAAAKGDRDLAVKSRINNARLDASKHYDVLAAIESAPEGTALDMLSKVDPQTGEGAQAAARIVQMHPGASAADLDEIVRDTVGHTSGFMFRFTGRPSEVGTDGYLYDKDSGLKVTGVPPRGFSQQQISDMRKEGNDMTTVKINGRDTPVHKYEAAGYSNVDQYVQAGVAQAQAIQRSKNTLLAASAHAAQTLSQQPGQPPPGQGSPQPGAGGPQSAPGAPQQGAPQQGAPQPQRQLPPGVSPNAQSTGGRLDFSDAPHSPEVNTGRSGPNDTEKAINEGYGKDVIASASTAAQRVAAANSAIQGANNAQIAVHNGALTGPLGSRTAFYQTMLGNPVLLKEMWGNPAARQVLEKALKNDAIMGIEKESQSGGAQLRLGQATLKLATEQLAASADMTPEAIMTMTNAVKANSQYDKQKFGSDYATYLRTPGVDRRVDAYSGWYDNKYPNTTTINPNTLNGGGTKTIKGVTYVQQNGKWYKQ